MLDEVDVEVVPREPGQAVILAELQRLGGTGLDAAGAEAALGEIELVVGEDPLLGTLRLLAGHGDARGGTGADAGHAGAALALAGLRVDHQLGVAPEVGRDRQLLEGVVGRDRGREGVAQGEAHAHDQAPQPREDLLEIADHGVIRGKGT